MQLPTEEETAVEEPAQDLLQESEASNVPIAPMDPTTTPVTERKPVEDLLIPSSTTTSEEASASETLVDEDIPTPSAERHDPIEKPAIKELVEVEDGESNVTGVEKPEEEDQDPDTTIRLVGGGGAAGIVPSESEPESNDRSDTASLRSESSVASDSTTGEKKGKAGKKGDPKKKKSISMGLKRISQLGGRKRTDSKGEVPSVPAP